ncbi:MAG: hypothetical protein H6668_15915 [Ardenticatenaceae bacterium]|nr:hypothetical protein [Ardenticatenaceae bacterium]
MTKATSPMTIFTKIVCWFVAVNALAGAILLLFWPAHTDTLFFWEIRPPLNAALFGALYLGGAVVVGYLTYKGQWEPARFLVPVLVSTVFTWLPLASPGLLCIGSRCRYNR